MKDKRVSPRNRATFKVVILHPALGQVVGHIRDISNSGVFLDVNQSALFECGQIVAADIIGNTDVDIDPQQSMEVVRVEFSGIALKFVKIMADFTEPYLVDQFAE